MARSFLFFLVLSLSSMAHAGGYLLGGGLYQSDSTGSSGVSATTRTNLNLGAGYLEDGGFAIGVLYFQDSISGGGTLTQSGVGVSFGVFSQESVYLLASYFPSASYSGGSSLKGNGFQIDVGYRIKSGKMAFAPQLSYRTISYDSETSGGSRTTSTKIDPMFMFLMEF